MINTTVKLFDGTVIDPRKQLSDMLKTMGIELVLRTLVNVIEEHSSINDPDDPEGTRCYFVVEPLRDIIEEIEPIRP